MNKEFKIGDKLSPEDIEVGMVVDIVNRSSGDTLRKDIKITKLTSYGGFEHTEGSFGNHMFYNVILKGWMTTEHPVTTSDKLSSVSEQSITEAIKTLSQAAQELSTHVSVDGKGNVTVYSDYHQEELVFDTAEKLLQYIECVKKLNSFGE
ncbi:hypothetical protein VP14_197 [Vibrio phage VPMCC14]|nr:hypothetical protein VP14_197 [Vibrio phage VPMCC14]